MLQTKNITCNYQTDPIGIGEDIQFGWVLESYHTNVMQTAYQLQIAEDAEFNTIAYDSGIVKDDNSAHVKADGFSPASSTRYYVRMQIQDNHGQQSPWSTYGFFETVLLDPGLWKAKFITAETEEDATVSDARLLRNEFQLIKRVSSARAYATALELYELFLNGERVGESVLTPGWTSYDKRQLYQTYDITELLQEGVNCIGAMVGAGWYKGVMGFILNRNNYGKQTAFFCQVIKKIGLLCKIVANATGLSVFAGPVEATAIGNLMIQAKSMGQIKSIVEGRKIIRKSFDIKKYLPEE